MIKLDIRELIIAGPCSVDTEENLDRIAEKVSALGLKYLRGGAFKPRTSPYSFKGIGEKGIFMLERTAAKYGLKTVSEITDYRYMDLFAEHIDILQIGARNMQNFVLLREAGRSGKRILLKRGFMNTIDELMYSVEHLTAGGCEDIIICERGVRTFQNHSRFSLDVTSIMEIKDRTSFPVILDPSHSTGKAVRVRRAALAGLAAGADGYMVEAHVCPEKSLSDAEQTIDLDELELLVEKSVELSRIL